MPIEWPTLPDDLEAPVIAPIEKPTIDIDQRNNSLAATNAAEKDAQKADIAQYWDPAKELDETWPA